MSIPLGTPITYTFFSGRKAKGIVGKHPKGETRGSDKVYIMLNGGEQGFANIERVTILREENEL